MKFSPLVAALPLLLAAPGAGADSWPAPRVKEVFSESREYFVRVLPGESLGDTFGFGGEKKGRYALAEFYRRAADRSYRLIAEATLLNPVAPVGGALIQSYELRDLFQPDEIESFPHSVSSIRWRDGPAYVRPDQKTLLITLKAGGDFLFGLESGQFKYCEYRHKVYRCRTANQPGQWMPNSAVQLTR